MNRTRIGENENLPLDRERIEVDLQIMDRHAEEVLLAEAQVAEEERRRDREIRDSHLHSIPKAKKHLRE